MLYIVCFVVHCVAGIVHVVLLGILIVNRPKKPLLPKSVIVDGETILNKYYEQYMRVVCSWKTAFFVNSILLLYNIVSGFLYWSFYKMCSSF